MASRPTRPAPGPPRRPATTTVPGPGRPAGADPAEPEHAGDDQGDRQRGPAQDARESGVVLGPLDLLGREDAVGAGGGCSGPPGTGSHGTRSTASATKATSPSARDHSGDPPPVASRSHQAPSADRAARSSSRCRQRAVSSASVSPKTPAQHRVEVAAARDLLVEPHQRLLPAGVGEHQAGHPGALVGGTEVRGGLVELGLPGQLVRRAVAAHLGDDLARRGRDRQVDRRAARRSRRTPPAATAAPRSSAARRWRGGWPRGSSRPGRRPARGRRRRPGSRTRAPRTPAWSCRRPRR